MAADSAAPTLVQPLLAQARSARTADAWARALRLLGDFIADAEPRPDWRALSEHDWTRFIAFCASRPLAAGTITRLWGDLRCALALFDVPLPSGRRLDLLRQGLGAVTTVPRPAPRAVGVSRLLLAWRDLPADTPIRRRDRALILLALLLGARPVDLLAVGRSDDFLAFGQGNTRLRLFRDKGSRLGGRSVSRWLVLQDADVLPVSATIRACLEDVPRERVRPSVDPAVVFFPAFVRMDRPRFGRPLESTTVSRILRRFLVGAGLPPPQTRAQLIRSFAASSAYELGLDLRELCLHFRWEDPSTFLRHYFLRGVEQPLDALPRGPRDGSRVSAAFAAALRRALRS